MNIGDEVRKIKGYPFAGKVVSTYNDGEKVVVKHKDDWEHIFRADQMTLDHPEYQYLDLIKDVLKNGDLRKGRNGDTYGVFGRQIRFDLNEGFPLLTTKRVHFKSIVGELLWMLSGDTNIDYLNNNGITIWDEWADQDGNLGPVYGSQWRTWQGYEGHIDQITQLIDNLKKDPYSRRHVVSAWNPVDIPNMALAPCHCLFQFFVDDIGRLSCQLYQRSADLGLGVPFNIASYALLTQLIARETRLKLGEFVHSFGDLHIYANHVDALKEQLTREPMPFPYVLIESNKGIFDLEIEDIKLMHYNSHPTIKMDVSA